MKKRKSNRIKKYMVQFCIVLVSVVVSTVLAGYIGSKSVEKDIPDETSQELQKMPEREFLEMLYSNLTEIKSALQLGKNRDFCNFNIIFFTDIQVIRLRYFPLILLFKASTLLRGSLSTKSNFKI